MPTLTKIPTRTMRCQHCDHRWPTRIVGRLPLICPNCRCWYWNTPVALAPCVHNKAR